MTDAPVVIPLAQLHPHPDNPRLFERADVVAQIKAQIDRTGKFDPAHALLVRPLGEVFQMVAGHHRAAAAHLAGLDAVPCWVREMDDDEAFMALVLANSQSELLPLERGLHALKVVQKAKGGRGNKDGVRKYAEDVGKDHALILREIKAAEVWQSVDPGHQFSSDKIPPAKNLAELHAAASWLWPALVSRLIREGWNVDTACQQAGRLKDVPEPPSWTDGERIARLIAAGTFKPGDVARMAKTAQEASAIIERVELDATDYQQELQDRLEADRPASVSAVQTIADRVVSAQAEAKRQHEETERAKRRARQADRERAEQRVALLRKAVTVKQWNDLDPETKEMLLNLDPTTVPRHRFNDEKSMDVEWAMKTHNPLTGCLHKCPYCYARDIAEDFRFRLPELYPEGFEPTFHPEQVLTPRFNRPSKEAERDHRHKNVFLCSMADLYGRWNPDPWIEVILRESGMAPWWNFLCLTKFPKRMAEFDIPSNVWMGATVDLQARVAATEAGFAKVNSKVRWLSIEPMLERLRFKRLDLFQWVVIGGASKSSQTPAWRPPFDWIVDFVLQAREAGCKVYFKSNLIGCERKNLKKDFPESDKPGQDYIGGSRILELPYDAPIKADPVEAPAVFHYLKARGETKS